MPQKQPEREDVRDEQQWHEQGGNRVGRAQLPWREPGGVALVEGVAVFRLAIAEAVQAPEVAQALDSFGRAPGRAALRRVMTEARAAGLIEGRPADLAEQFAGLLWRDLLISLLLGVARRPSSRAIEKRARDAADAFLRLHPIP